jgi:hypothetical protein
MGKKHWIAMAGIRGCIPNLCASCDTKTQAIEFLCEVHDNARGLKSDLQKYQYSEHCPGNEYCEIVECTCNDPAVHNDL